MSVALPRNLVWTQVPERGGSGFLLVAQHGELASAWAIAPPTVRLGATEPVQSRTGWRAARFDAPHVDELFLAVGGECVASTYACITYEEVLRIVSSELRECVRNIHTRQGALADAFEQLIGSDETRRRTSGALNDEVLVPDTVGELLERAGAKPALTPVSARGDADLEPNCASDDYVAPLQPMTRSRYEPHLKSESVNDLRRMVLGLCVALAVSIAALLMLGGFSIGDRGVDRAEHRGGSVPQPLWPWVERHDVPATDEELVVVPTRTDMSTQPATQPEDAFGVLHDEAVFAATQPASPSAAPQSRVQLIDGSSWRHRIWFRYDDRGRFTVADGNVHYTYGTAQFQGANRSVRGLAARAELVTFSPDGKTLAAIATDGSLRLWDARGQRPLGLQLSRTSGVDFTTMTFHPDRRTLATGTKDGDLQLWDSATGAPLGRPIKAATGPVQAIAFSPDGRALAATSHGEARIWDVIFRSPIGLAVNTHSVGQTTATWSLAKQGAATPTGVARTNTRWSVRGPDRNVDSHVAIAFSRDTGALAMATDDAVQIWNVANGKRTRTSVVSRMGHTTSIAFSPDGTTLAIGAEDGRLQLWNVDHGRREGAPMRGHAGPVRTVAFSFDGKRLASGGADKTVRLWDVADRRREGRPLIGRSASVESVTFAPDGRTLASASADRSLQLWSLDQLRESSTTSSNRATNHHRRIFSRAFLVRSKWSEFGNARRTMRFGERSRSASGLVVVEVDFDTASTGIAARRP